MTDQTKPVARPGETLVHLHFIDPDTNDRSTWIGTSAHRALLRDADGRLNLEVMIDVDGEPAAPLAAEGGEAAVTMTGEEREAQLQVALNAALAQKKAHERTIAALREQLAQAQAAPGPSGLTRAWSGYDDDECWFPMFANLADAKAYAEQEYRAQCTGYGTKAPDELAWSERKAYTEAHGYPGLYDLETDSGFVVCELLVHASLASGLVERPIETDEETAEPAPRVEGQSEIPLTGQQEPPAEPTRGYRVGDLVEIVGRGVHYDGKTGIVTGLDDDADGEYSISLDVEGFAGPVWCSPGEVRHAAESGAVS